MPRVSSGTGSTSMLAWSAPYQGHRECGGRQTAADDGEYGDRYRPTSAVGVGASASGTNAVGGSVGLTLTVANVDRAGAEFDDLRRRGRPSVTGPTSGRVKSVAASRSTREPGNC